MQALLRTALLFTCVGLLMACEDASTLTWTEDVRLPDGRVVALSRWVEFKGPHAMGDTPTESRLRLEFKHPDTGETIEWESARETGFTKTVALWLERRTPRLLGTPAYGGDYFRLGCPNPPYMLFEYVSGKWISRPLEQIGIDAIRANLTTHPKKMREEIEGSDRHLNAARTSDSYTFRNGTHRVPYLIKFQSMPAQSFDNQNCDRPFDELLDASKGGREKF